MSRWAYTSGIKYSLANGWACIGGGLKTGGFKNGILRYSENDLLYMAGVYETRTTTEKCSCEAYQHFKQIYWVENHPGKAS